MIQQVARTLAMARILIEKIKNWMRETSSALSNPG
jgi:hypothetical protein